MTGVFYPEYIRGEVAQMTDYEIIMIFLGILALLLSSGGLLVALLNFLDQRNSKIKNANPVGTRIGEVHKD